MKFYPYRLTIAFAAFIVGVCTVWLWLIEPQKQNLEVIPVAETPTTVPPVEPTLPQPQPVPSHGPRKAVSVNNLRPSANYWGKDFKQVALQVSHLSKNRKLATVGDTLYMLDAKNQIVWTWTTEGAPLTDFPIIDSNGILHVIAYDLTWVALDSRTGKKLWQGTANGRAVYSQIELYGKDMYLVVTDMTGYRKNAENDFPGVTINDKLTLCKGNSILWDKEIPADAKIRVRKGKVFAVFKRNKQIVTKEIKIPSNFDKTIGKIDSRSKYN